MESKRTVAFWSFVLYMALLAAVQTVPLAAAAAPGDQQHALQNSPGSIKEDGLGQITPEAENMVEWMRQHGGEVNVVIRTLPDLGRKLFAAREMKKGDVIARIPREVCYTLQGASGDEEQDEMVAAATQMLKDMADPSSPYQPYFAILPGRDGVWSHYDIPDTYLPLIQNEPMESVIALLQANALGDDSSSDSGSIGHSDEATAALDKEQLRYALSLIETRSFPSPPDHPEEGLGLHMMPLLDMADHRNDCPNRYYEGPCSSSGDGDVAGDKQCCIWVALEDLAAGQEVCNYYRYLLQDIALIQYGYLQDGPISQQLSSIDRHDFDPEQPFVASEAVEQGGLPFEASDPDHVKEELKRLKQLLADLKAKDDSLSKTITPHPRDSQGWFLKQMWLLRSQRQEAIAAEIKRMEQALLHLAAADREL